MAQTNSQEFHEPPIADKQSSLAKFFTWSAASSEMLRAAEKKILSYVRWPLRCFYVDLGSCVGRDDKIWTLHAPNNTQEKTPLLLVHGLGAGIALWVLNLDTFAKNRPVYAIDMLGFGRSSRPEFAEDALKAEKQFVKSIEEWRREMNLDKMIILGHSMGGYLAASYAMDHPDRVQHLILADAWGFPERPAKQENTRDIPWWVKAIAFTLKPMNPLFAVRAAGPYGQWVS
jgi:abhydrolase domain-containing protein 4